jgi:hypothetical protein
MRKAMGLVIFIAVLFFMGTIIPNVFAGQPKLLIPELTFDFGYTPTKTTISHYYLVKNAGTDSLKIENVKPG